jgi:hypothetical protein
MQSYTSTQMVKKTHAKVIEKQLRKLGSKTPSALKISRDKSLANLLYLACGGGKYALKVEKILTIGNEEFSLDQNGVKELCKKSVTRSTNA